MTAKSISINPLCQFKSSDDQAVLVGQSIAFTIGNRHYSRIYYCTLCACLGYCIPTICFFYCYSRLLCSIHRHTQSARLYQIQFCKVAKTVLGLVLLYLICWTPYWIFTIWVLSSQWLRIFVFETIHCFRYRTSILLIESKYRI